MLLGLPVGNWFLNAKDRKKLLASLQDEFGIEELPEGVYIQNGKDKVFLVNRDLERIDFASLFIDAAGLYLGTWQIDGFRLSMEGAQLLAPLAKKNVVDLDDEGRSRWLKGEDVPWPEDDRNAFVIVRHGSDVLGCGKIRSSRDGKVGDAVLLNFVPKARRLIVVNE